MTTLALLLSAISPGQAATNAVRDASLLTTLTACPKTPAGTARDVTGTLVQRCSWWSSQSGKIDYRAERLPDGDGPRFRIGLRARFEIPGSVPQARRQFMLRRAYQCVPLAREIWARYRIDFDLRLDSTDQPLPGNAPHRILLTDDEGRFYHDHYNFRGIQYENCLATCKAGSFCAEFCENRRQQEFCLKLVHETGHLLGLMDEYPDPACPRRPIIDMGYAPASVMAASSGAAPENVDFHPRHIHTVLEPLCGAW